MTVQVTGFCRHLWNSWVPGTHMGVPGSCVEAFAGIWSKPAGRSTLPLYASKVKKKIYIFNAVLAYITTA